MKKTSTLLVAAFVSFQVSAQTIDGKLGTSLAFFSGSDIDNEDMTILNPGLLLGGCARFGEGKMRIATELLYIQKGGKWVYDDGDYNKVTYNYLEVNGMANFFVSDNFSLNAGIYLGYVESGKYTISIDGEKISESIAYGDDDRRMDFGPILGLAYHINETMNVDIRYGMGLYPLGEGFNVYNNTIQIAFGYSFVNLTLD